MPTGYTQPIYDGEPITFRQFALRCARQFGALISLRDEPLGGEIPDEIKPSDYHLRKADEATAQLETAKQWSAPEADEAALRDWERVVAHYKEAVEDKKAMRERYQYMANRARAWEAPEGHRALRDFMLAQLRTSYDFDVYEPQKPPAKPMSGEEYKRQQIQKHAHDLAYHMEQYRKEADGCAKATEWIKELKASLPSA